MLRASSITYKILFPESRPDDPPQTNLTPQQDTQHST